MNYSISPILNKSVILEHYSQEQIMEFYLKVPIQSGLFVSPLRVDKHPTCSFYKNKKGDLIFKDFATGQHLDPFNVVATIFNCSYYKALKIIANDFGIYEFPNLEKTKGIINPNPIIIEKKDTKKIQIQIKPFSGREIKWWQEFGVNENILNEYRVYSCKYVFIDGQIVSKSSTQFPIFGYYGGKRNGTELWKCYFPFRKEFRFISNWSNSIIQGINNIPDKGDILVITKSMKDVMCLHSFNVPAIAPMSETTFVSNLLLENLKERFNKIVVLYDNDMPGLSNMIKIRKEHPELNYMFIPLRFKAKDISDFFKKYGRSKTEEEIKKYLTWLRNKN